MSAPFSPADIPGESTKRLSFAFLVARAVTRPMLVAGRPFNSESARTTRAPHPTLQLARSRLGVQVSRWTDRALAVRPVCGTASARRDLHRRVFWR